MVDGREGTNEYTELLSRSLLIPSLTTNSRTAKIKKKVRDLVGGVVLEL